MRSAFVTLLLIVAACGGGGPKPNVPTNGKPVVKREPALDEVHFASTKQLTFGGENAEAYWSWGGDQLMMQASPNSSVSCDRIYRFKTGDPKNMTQVSNGKG